MEAGVLLLQQAWALVWPAAAARGAMRPAGCCPGMCTPSCHVTHVLPVAHVVY